MPTSPPGDYAVRIHPPGWADNPAVVPAEVYPVPGGLTSAQVWAVAGRVVVFDTLIQRSKQTSKHRAYLLDRGSFAEAPGLPAVKNFGRDTFGHQAHANGKVVLATGEQILIWDGNGYEWTGAAFERRWELSAKEAELGGQIGVPWGQDGFFFLSNRRVMYARRGQRPTRVHPDAENVMSLSPGPQDSVILCHGQNAKSFVARIWFPEEGTYIPILRGHLGWSRSGASPDLYWNSVNGHTHFAPLATFPDSDALALKRIRPRGTGYRVPTS